MVGGRVDGISKQLRTIFDVGSVAGLTDGRFCVVVYPGRRTFSVGEIGRGLGDSAEAQTVDLTAGETATLKFSPGKAGE